MNKKGYLLSELIICFALSFVILIVIFNTTISLNQKLSDLFINNQATSKQIIFNRKIADDFTTKTISGMEYTEETKTCKITYNDSSISTIIIGEKDIEYNNEKIAISNNMKIVGNVICKQDTTTGVYILKIPIKYARDKKDYGIELYNINSITI